MRPAPASRPRRRARAVALAVALAVASGAPAPGASGEELLPLPRQPAGVPFPTEAWPERAPGPEVDAPRLAAALADAFAARPERVDENRAVLVVHRGAIVAEAYAPGFGPDTPFHSWSMAKSVTGALVGILVRDGRLALDGPAPVPEWRAPGDPRGALTLRHLLNMTTGLDADDDLSHPARSKILWMMFGGGAGDAGGYAASFPLLAPPNTRWAYSTATSMLLARAVGQAAGGGREAALGFMRRELFEPLGIRSAVPEFDAAGSFLGGGFVWMTARDWARFGLLYLRDGVWEDASNGAARRRILPEGWVDFSRSAAPAPNNTTFGAHLWRNVEPARDQFPRLLPHGPDSIFSAQGANGQLVVLVPTHDLVIVRLGELDAYDFTALTPLLAEILASFPPL